MFALSKPQGDGPIPPALLSYVGRKLKNDFFHLVLDAFQTSNMTQAELAKKVGMDKGQLHRQLGAPGNWTIDTVAKLLFAINGNVVLPTSVDVEASAPANMTEPDWLRDGPPALKSKVTTLRLPNPTSPRHATGAPQARIISSLRDVRTVDRHV